MLELTNWPWRPAVFIAGACVTCGGPYVVQGKAGVFTHGKFCSVGCRRRGRTRRMREAAGKVFCHACRQTVGGGEVLCAGCLGKLARPCLGKVRIGGGRYARQVGAWSGNKAYRCAVCGWWHNGRGAGAGDVVQQIVALLRISEQGRDWLAARGDGWSPEAVDREAWKRKEVRVS